MTETTAETTTETTAEPQTQTKPGSDVPAKSSRFGTMAKVKLIAALVLLALGAVVAVQNRAPVQVNFFFWGLSVRLTWLLVFTLLVGVICGMLLSLAIRRKKHH